MAGNKLEETKKFLASSEFLSVSFCVEKGKKNY